jgi:hypothetical protein
MVPTYRQAAAFIKRVRDQGLNPIFTSVSFVDSNALAESLREMGPKYTSDVIVTQVVPYFGSGATGVLEYRIQGLDFGIGTKISFGPSEHQASHKVWAVTLDGQGRFRNLELD